MEENRDLQDRREQYKKERLEAVLKWIIGTSVFGVLATISFILDVFFVI